MLINLSRFTTSLSRRHRFRKAALTLEWSAHPTVACAPSRSPLEPLFRALAVAEIPTSNIGDVDLVTDRNNIRKLLRFVQASSGKLSRSTSRLPATRRRCSRVEEQTRETIRGFRSAKPQLRRLTQACPEAATGSVGYTFGGLQVLCGTRPMGT